ncbi:MAG: hypothetical protein M1820_003761 [Bogoriella megaspora]|nr:MAG: hypothetical protein M1820_003761 [Bogoriella megaspora]
MADTALAQAALSGSAVDALSIVDKTVIGSIGEASASDASALTWTGLHNALQAALAQGHDEVAKHLLQHVKDVNLQIGHFGNAIQAAAFGGKTEMIDMLLVLGADVHSDGRFGTPLRVASLNGHTNAVELLLKKGAKLRRPSGDAIRAAVQGGHRSTLHILLNSLLSTKDVDWHYDAAIQEAAFRGYDSLLRDLLLRRETHKDVIQKIHKEFGSTKTYENLTKEEQAEMGNEVNWNAWKYSNALRGSEQRWRAGANSALQAAIIAGKEGTAVILLDYMYGKDGKIGHDSSYCPLTTESDAIGLRPNDLAQYRYEILLPRFEQQAKPNIPASSSASIDAITHAQDVLDDPKTSSQAVTGRLGYLLTGRGRLLRIAVWKGLFSIVRNLLDRGVDIDADGDPGNNCDSNKPTAVELAVAENHPDILSSLLARGAKLTKALSFAVRFRHLGLIEIIMLHRPDATIDFNFSDSKFPLSDNISAELQRAGEIVAAPLALAIEWGYQDVFDRLLKHLDAHPTKKPTLSIIVAAWKNREEMLKVLLSRLGETVESHSLKDTSRDIEAICARAMAAAMQNGHWSIVKSLIEDPCLQPLRRSLTLTAAREAGFQQQKEFLPSLLQSAGSDELRQDMLCKAIQGVAARKPGHRDESREGDMVYLRELLVSFVSHCKNESTGASCIRESVHNACKVGYAHPIEILLAEDKQGTTLYQHDQGTILRTDPGILQTAIGTDQYPFPTKYGQSLVDIIELLINHGAKVNGLDDQGLPPLYYAIKRGDWEIFQILIKAGADINVQVKVEKRMHLRHQLFDIHGRPKLETKKTRPANLLQAALVFDEHDANKNARQEHLKGRHNIIMYLVWRDLKFDPRDDYTLRFLNQECAHGRTEHVEGLLDHGASVHTPLIADNIGSAPNGAPLHVATFGGRIDTVEMLLKRGADPNAKVDLSQYQEHHKGLTPLGALVSNFYNRYHFGNHRSTVFQTGKESSVRGLEAGQLQVVERLIKEDVSREDLNEVFQFAVSQGAVSIARTLIEKGVSAREMNEPPPQKHSVPSTLLQSAVANPAMFEVLIENGVSVDQPADQVDMMIYANLQVDNPRNDPSTLRNLEFLLSRPEIQLSEAQANELAFKALQMQQWKAWALLKRDSFSFNHVGYQSIYSNTIQAPYNLLSSAFHYHPYNFEHIRTLLEHGADPECPGLHCTALIFLLRQGGSSGFDAVHQRLPTIKLLIEFGADVNHVKSDLPDEPVRNHENPKLWYGQSPLWLAVGLGGRALVEVLLEARADINADHGFGTPLARARECGNSLMAEYLVSRGAVHSAEDAWVEVGVNDVNDKS